MLEHSCCVTGHRDLPGELTAPLRELLQMEVARAAELGYDRFYSGFARGADLLFAEAVLRQGRVSPGLKLRAALPYGGRRDALAKNPRTRRLLAACDQVVCVSAEYSREVFARRNLYMLERCGLVIAVYDGRAEGGTFNTLRAARRMGREVRIVWP